MNIFTVTRDKRSECSKHLIGECGLCSDEPLLDIYRRFLQDDESDPYKLVNKVKKTLGVKRESEIFQSDRMHDFIGYAKCNSILRKYFKVPGPHSTTDLLSNFDIDGTLKLWEENSEKLFNRKFKHIGFQMIDFGDGYNELANIDLDELKAQGYDSFACVINTDVSSGRGKHWFCLFMSLDSDKIEFFNSSGNGPVKEIVDWAAKICKKYNCKLHKALSRKIQYSNTECGVWCLMYIYWRLLGGEIGQFESDMTDDRITELRYHIFR